MSDNAIITRVLFYQVAIIELQKDLSLNGSNPLSSEAAKRHWDGLSLCQKNKKELLQHLWKKWPVQTLQHLLWLCKRIWKLYLQGEVERSFYHLKILEIWVSIIFLGK